MATGSLVFGLNWKSAAKVYTKNETRKIGSHIPTLSDKYSDTMPFFSQLSADKFRRLGSWITATRLAEIIVCKSVFGRSKRVDQFGFAGI